MILLLIQFNPIPFYIASYYTWIGVTTFWTYSSFFASHLHFHRCIVILWYTYLYGISYFYWVGDAALLPPWGLEPYNSILSFAAGQWAMVSLLYWTVQMESIFISFDLEDSSEPHFVFCLHHIIISSCQSWLYFL